MGIRHNKSSLDLQLWFIVSGLERQFIIPNLNMIRNTHLYLPKYIKYNTTLINIKSFEISICKKACSNIS